MAILSPIDTTKKVVNCYHANIGACNGCDLEVFNLLSTSLLSKRQLEFKLVRSAKQSEVLLVTGSLSRPMVKKLKELKESVSASKTVIAVGACAINGGLWRKSYTIIGGIEKVLPASCFVPGCPPTPEAILYSIELALGLKKKPFAPLLYKEK
jgi:Ni,Fe-hydrogenase III small subunit